MKVNCDRSALADAVSVVSGVVASRTPTPVLQCIRITAEDGLLRLAATDLEVGLQMPVESVDIEEPGAALVPADKLNQILRACDAETVKLWTEDTSRIMIDAGNSHFTMYGYDPSEAPTVRDFGDATVDSELLAGTFQRLVRRTLFAAASEHSRYAINGVLFMREKRHIRMVATDGRRLAVARGECTSTGSAESTSCIIPTKALTLITKLVHDPEDTIRLAIDGNQVVMAIGDDGGAVLSSNLVEGSFPPFEDVIPKDQDKRVTFDPADLSSAIRRAALLTNDETKGVQMKFDDGKLTLISRAPEMGEAMIEMELGNYEGEPVEIGFNPGYLTDALKVVDDPEVMIELKAANKPGVIRTGADFTYVVMPVSL